MIWATPADRTDAHIARKRAVISRSRDAASGARSRSARPPLGVFAVGAISIGAASIGALHIGKTRIRKLRIDRLEVGQLIVTDAERGEP